VLFGGTSKELIHHFAGHEDTVHHQHQKGLSFENKHHHCAFLSDFLSPFEPADFSFHLQTFSVFYRQFSIPVNEKRVSLVRHTVSLRGPPVRLFS
jgi:hypothetical protein